MMKNINLQIEVAVKPEVIWRLKLFMLIMRFAVWVGGFGGVDFEIPERHSTKPLDISMNNDILETIAVNSVFGIDEVNRVYEIFKSYDLLVAACEYAQKTGYSNLEIACIYVKSTNMDAGNVI